MLVTSTEAFADYQKNEPDAEHQALVRARVVYGDRSSKRSSMRFAVGHDDPARGQYAANRVWEMR
ncbi:hypothetical protein ACNKHS_18330 [Shigella flexneri]